MKKILFADKVEKKHLLVFVVIILIIGSYYVGKYSNKAEFDGKVVSLKNIDEEAKTAIDKRNYAFDNLKSIQAEHTAAKVVIDKVDQNKSEVKSTKN